MTVMFYFLNWSNMDNKMAFNNMAVDIIPVIINPFSGGLYFESIWQCRCTVPGTGMLAALGSNPIKVTRILFSVFY